MAAITGIPQYTLQQSNCQRGSNLLKRMIIFSHFDIQAAGNSINLMSEGGCRGWLHFWTVSASKAWLLTLKCFSWSRYRWIAESSHTGRCVFIPSRTLFVIRTTNLGIGQLGLPNWWSEQLIWGWFVTTDCTRKKLKFENPTCASRFENLSIQTHPKCVKFNFLLKRPHKKAYVNFHCAATNPHT